MATAVNNNTNNISNTYTFSGQDVRVFVYRNLSEIKTKVEQEEKTNRDKFKASLAQAKQEVAIEALQAGELFTGIAKGSETDGKAGTTSLIPSHNVSREELDSRVQARKAQKEEEWNARNFRSSAPYMEIGSLDALSYSSFREKNAVRTLGRSHAVAYTRGPRTIAGSLNFNVIQENELLRFANNGNTKISETARKSALLDQILPFHIILIFSNEFGAHSALHLFNVEIASENQRMSVHDIIIQNSMSFYATDVLPMENIGNSFKSVYQMLKGITQQVSERHSSNGRLGIRKSLDSFSNDKAIQERLNRSRGLF